MLTDDEADVMCRKLVAIQAELEQYEALTRDIHDRVTTAKANRTKLPHKELTDMLAELLKNKQDYLACSMRGVALYEKLKGEGLATRKLDDWAQRVKERAKSLPE